MNVNTITRNSEDYASGKLPVALYKNHMTAGEGKNNLYFARAASRTTLSMQNIAEDIIVTKALEGFSTEQIMKIWNVVNGAVIDRVLNGFTVDAGIGYFQARITGTFNSQQDSFDHKRHSIDVGFRSSPSVKELTASLDVLILQGNSIVPEITDVFDVASKERGILTPKKMLNITGKNIMLSGENEEVGLWFINTEDESKSVKVNASECGINKAGMISCVIPELEPGKYILKIVTQFSRSKLLSKDNKEFISNVIFTVK